MPERATVLYDPGCGFCCAALVAILALDRRRIVRAIALGTPESDELLGELAPVDRWASWHLLEGDRRYSAGAAIAPLFRRLPGGWAVAAVAGRAPRQTESLYRWVADHRRLLSRPVPGQAKWRARARLAARG